MSNYLYIAIPVVHRATLSGSERLLSNLSRSEPFQDEHIYEGVMETATLRALSGAKLGWLLWILWC